ncbi:MAG: cation diffusion facilitator family transporter [Desulfobacteraceae bacterium]|jgi:cation diffusion facilitator family transporter
MKNSTNTAEDRSRQGPKITLIGALVNLFLIVFKFLAGILGHSQALIADAVHSISDLFTDAVVLVGLRISRKEPDEDHHFGHARYETLASAFVGSALGGVAIYLGLQAVFNIYHHTEKHPTLLAVGAAALAIALKEVLYRYTVQVGRRIKSAALQANAWHHRSDALSSVAVLLGVGGAQINPDWHILDAYAALVVSFFILKVGLDVIRTSAREFTDAAPGFEVPHRVRSCADTVPGVIGTHDVRVRMSGGLYQMEVHVVVDANLTVKEGHRIAKEVEACLREEFDELTQVIIHVDPSTP